MLLSITAEGSHASDLSYLLHKHPDRLQTFGMSFGKAHVFYPTVASERTTACLLLEVDPIGMVRKHLGRSATQAAYVNDRPLVTSSFMSTAIASVFGSALAGRCRDRAESAKATWPWSIQLTALPVRGGDGLLERMFGPLGYRVEASTEPLDSEFPDWGKSVYTNVELTGRKTLSELLNHLYVLIPVFDNQKHYFVGSEEIEKLLLKGEGWLTDHPDKEFITRRYLRHQAGMTRRALTQLRDEDHPSDLDEAAVASSVIDQAESGTQSQAADSSTPRAPALNEQRHGRVIEALIGLGAGRVIDLGCGEGKLLKRMIAVGQFKTIVGVDVSIRALDIAARRLRLEDRSAAPGDRVRLLHGSLMYRDERFAGFDAACLVEVIEHLDPPRLAAAERVVFEFAKPTYVVITTPNAEYNRLWDMPDGQMRHKDHRFEWNRDQFETWSQRIAAAHHYTFEHCGVGAEDAELGSPTQMAIFTKTNDRTGDE